MERSSFNADPAAAALDAEPCMDTLHCTEKLLDRLKVPIASPSPPPSTTVLGNWYATALFWQPQVALLVNERTLLPVLMPLAPASTLAARFPHELATVLGSHGAIHAFIANEVAAMGDVSVAMTCNRSVVGTMNEFALVAEGYRGDMATADVLMLSMRLADTPCGALKHKSPERQLKELVGASTQWN
jgi:hypothetical protein